jgi:putative spermidine/putrescine transport system ATP-binding protein
MPALELTGLTKRYGTALALRDLSLRVEDGELVCLLGPSGCGKTTTLRVIAGFEPIEAGAVRIGDQDVTRVPAQHRDIGVVFQSYALFPHLTVDENVGFGLKMRRKPRAEIEAAVREALRIVRLDDVGGRLPRQLSGGQQQRVALARAIAIRPRLLLLDEPLSNLDAKLRDEMREEIRRIQRAVGITTLFVTHDQLEALALADRMAVMDQGRIVQLGTPTEIYERPAHAFVASFIGQANLLRGRVVESDGQAVRFETAGGLMVVGEGAALTSGSDVIGVIKSERIALTAAASADRTNSFATRIDSRTYLGAALVLGCAVGGERLTVVRPNDPGAPAPQIGEAAFVRWRTGDCLVLPAGNHDREPATAEGSMP